MKRKLTRIFKSLQKAPERKHYLEFVTAALSIPVLLTVIFVNLNSLNVKKEATSTEKAQPSPQTVIIRETVPSQSNTTNNQPATPTSASCKKQIGPVSITYPKEGATVNDNPVNFIVKYDDSTYCSVVWSYRVNGGSWSEYSSNSPSIYNLPNGNITFELRVQSTVSQDQDQIERQFTYQGTTVAATPTPTSAVTPTP